MLDIKGFILRRLNRNIMIPLAQRKLKNIYIYNSADSIKYIIEHECSVSRFGDGEFDIMMGKNGNTFQTANVELAQRLKNILVATDAPNHVCAIPLPLKDDRNIRNEIKEFWNYYTLRYINQILPYLKKQFYLDTQLSRFYIMYDNRDHSAGLVELLRQIWNGKDLLIIEGCQSRTGVGNDLYDNAKSIQRIIGYATNAYDYYEDMLNAIVAFARKDQLIILSYGMCATVLAYDLAKLGYRAIDLGHLDIEYEWYTRGVEKETPIDAKFTNDAGDKGRKEIAECLDENYRSQIICDITK